MCWWAVTRCLVSMSGHSTHRYHQADRCRSPRSRRGSDNESTIILPDVVVNVLEEEEDDILKRLQRPFTDIRVKRRNSKLTFIGSDQNRADAMMYVYRYLSHVKRVECIRWSGSSDSIILMLYFIGSEMKLQRSERIQSLKIREGRVPGLLNQPESSDLLTQSLGMVTLIISELLNIWRRS